MRENVGSLLNKMGALAVEHREKAELVNAFFAAVISGKTGPQESQPLEIREEAW